MTTVVRKWGNSIGIRLPKTLAQEVEISEGASVIIEARNGRIIITPARRYRYQLADLVRHITPKNRHEAIETGEPRGKEAW
jgi:antitoxin MazE